MQNVSYQCKRYDLAYSTGHDHDKSSCKMSAWLIKDFSKKSKHNYECYQHHLHWLPGHHLTKALCEISAQSLKDFLCESGKSETELCLNMLINPSLHNFLENNIFDFQITVDRVHPVKF